MMAHTIIHPYCLLNMWGWVVMAAGSVWYFGRPFQLFVGYPNVIPIRYIIPPAGSGI